MATFNIGHFQQETSSEQEQSPKSQLIKAALWREGFKDPLRGNYMHDTLICTLAHEELQVPFAINNMKKARWIE